MSDREAINWARISRWTFILIVTFLIGKGIAESVMETSANIAQHTGAP